MSKLNRGFAHILIIPIIVIIFIIIGFILYKGGSLKNIIPGDINLSRLTDDSSPIDFPKPFEDGYFPGLLNPEVIASFNDIEVTGDAKPVVFHYPADGFVTRTILIKNIGKEEAVVAFRPKIEVPNYDEQLFINHPQPSKVYLNSGETHPIRLIYALQTGGPNVLPWKKGEKKDAPINVDLEVWRNNGINNKLAVSKSLTLENIIEIIGEAGPSYHEPEANANISGIVVDHSGKPLANVRVEISTGRGRPIDIKTDTSGKFSAEVYAFQRGGTNVWGEIIVGANQPQNRLSLLSYGQDSVIFHLKAQETKSVTLTLQPAPMRASYDIKETLDLGWQGYGWDTTDNGNIMVTVPFHTVAQPGILEKEGVLTIFNKDGKVLGIVPINGETPSVDVSADGSMIATTKGYNDGSDAHWGGNPILVDNTGKIIKEISIPKETHFWWGVTGDRASSVAISSDNKNLAFGDQFGRLFLVDIASGKIIWEKFTNGQVRWLEFDSSNQMRLIASSGDGYLRAFDTKGELIWKTYVDAWLTGMDMSNNYVAATSKSGRGNIHLIEKNSGKTVWSYPVDQRGSGIKISPDESFVWYGTDLGFGSTPLISAVFSIKGKPLFETNSLGQGGAFTADSKYLVVKSPQRVALYNRDGQLLWQKNVAGFGDQGAMNHFAWISSDAKRIAVGLNNKAEQRAAGQIYILEGRFVDSADATDSFETDRQQGQGQPPVGGQSPPLPPNDQQPGGKCGDNICDGAESANPKFCPADCSN